MKPRNKRHEKKILDILKNVSLFKEFADKETDLKKIIAILSEKSYTAGSYILQEGEEGETLSILVEGKVTILKRTLENETYTLVKLKAENTFNPFFGELALLDSDKRSASIKADTNCRCFSIARNSFINFGNTNPKLGLAITREISNLISQRFRKQNKDILLLFEALVSEIDEERAKKKVSAPKLL
ncbi:cyclic nucleotide-binding domain-containing protein [Spirochaetota bacterium]